MQTAWSPPTPVIQQLAIKSGKNFTLEYNEEGCDFIGRSFCNADGTNSDECYTHEDAPEDLKESLGYHSQEDLEEEYDENMENLEDEKKTNQTLNETTKKPNQNTEIEI
jgi:hypothetical protein